MKKEIKFTVKNLLEFAKKVNSKIAKQAFKELAQSITDKGGKSYSVSRNVVV